MKHIFILVRVVDKDVEIKYDMPNFSCDVDVISTFTPCSSLDVYIYNTHTVT